MINFSIYNPKRSNDMDAANLEVGQKLVRLVEGSSEYSEHRLAEYTVAKVLKTRLVLTSAEGNELRILVKNSKWSYENGKVTTDREGDMDSYRRTAFKFATEDDRELLEGMVANRAKSIAVHQNRIAARNAVAPITNSRFYDLDAVEAAIAALQTVAADIKAGKE